MSQRHWTKQFPSVCGALLLTLFGAAPPAAAASAVAGDPRVQQALALARTWLEGQRAYDRIPGVSAAIVHDQEVLWIGAYGQADVATERPAAADTLYSICSISKLFTSVAVLRERDEGRLRLDDPVGKHLPWFALARTEGEGDITIEGLLTHASGLPRESDFPYWAPPDFDFPTPGEIIARLGKQAALYAPERAFQYSNLGMALAGEVVGATSSMPYGDYIRKNILVPLELAGTTPELPEKERGRRLATGYAALDREGRRAPMPFFRTNGIAPAAGFASTAGDLARFASWQFRLLEKGGREVLKATTLREMHRVHWVEPDFETLWGLGFEIWRKGERVFVGHGGSCPGFRTMLLIMPEEKVAAVFMANAGGVDSQKWAQTLYDIVGPAIRAALKEPGKAKPADPGMARYTGTYSDAPWGGETAVVPWEDGLAMIDLPGGDPIGSLTRLRKTGDHTFRRVRKDDSLGEEVVFEIGADGRAARYTRHSNPWPRVGEIPGS
jgi:CubicO group peptidase (beta-lactamase class C family)